MQIKINEDFLEDYSEQFSKSICKQFFQEKSAISGKEILAATPSRQVNFFVVKLLFSNWQNESQRLESPFFDYDTPEVKKAMIAFMNVLSQHIKVAEKEFCVLLEDALRDTLYLLINPGIYLDIELDRRGEDALTEKCVKNITKYLRIEKEEFSSYLQKNIGVDREDLLVKDGFSREVIEKELALLNEVVPISLEQLEEAEEAIETPSVSKGSEDDTPFSIDEDDLIAPRVARASRRREGRIEDVDDDDLEEPIDTPLPSSSRRTLPKASDKKETEELPPPPTIDPARVITNMDEDDEVEEEEDDDTFNDTFQSQRGPTIADSQGQISHVLNAVSINQRYMFINELYDGDADVFVKSLDEINQSTTFDTAVDHLVKNYAKEYDWDMNSDEVKELLKIVFRRFR